MSAAFPADENLGLMLEMADARKNHGHSMLIGGLDGFFIPYGPPWLDNGGYSRLGSHVNPVTEREERIGTKDTAFCGKYGFHLGDLDGINSAHLARRPLPAGPWQ